MKRAVREYLSMIGSRGGRKSRRSLDPETARGMVRIREARRAFRRFHARCFWSHDPGYRVEEADIPWIAEQLMRYGGRAGWKKGASLLCS